MSWWLKEIPRYKCRVCGRRASVVLMNPANAECGFYCAACGRCEMNQRNDESRA